MQFAAAPLLEKIFSVTMEKDERFAGFPAADFHVLPAKFVAHARAKRLGNGFLRGEPRRQMRCRILVRETIRNLARPQNALEKSLPKLFVRRADPGDFNEVDANAKNHVGLVR